MNCLRCLADNPVVQENVRAEVKNAVNEDQSLLPVVFKEQPYLKAFIKEAFRYVLNFIWGKISSLNNDFAYKGLSKWYWNIQNSTSKYCAQWLQCTCWGKNVINIMS